MEKDFSKDNDTSHPNSFIPYRYSIAEVRFDDNIVSKNGEKIPLEKDCNPHQCQNRQSELELWTEETPYQNMSSLFVDTFNNRRLVHVCLRNTTRNFSRKQIVEILQFGMPPEMADFDATVSNRFQDLFRGKCYPFGCALCSDNSYKPVIIARINSRKSEYPSWIDRGKDGPRSSCKDQSTNVTHTIRKRGYISLWIRSAEECLVYVLSHELRHLWQRDHKAGWVYGSKGRRSSERDADAYAIAKVREWRKKSKAKEVEQAFQLASIFLSGLIPRIISLLTTALKRRSGINQ